MNKKKQEARLVAALSVVVIVACLSTVSADSSVPTIPERASNFPNVKGEVRVSRRPRVDGSGNLIVFESTLLRSQKSRKSEKSVYLYDRTSKTMTAISNQASGALDAEPFISGNGLVVAYQSYVKNPVPNLPPAKADIVLFDRSESRFSIATLGLKGEGQNGECSSPVLDFSAKQLLFSCNATNLIAAQTISIPQVFYLDVPNFMLDVISRFPADGPPAADNLGNRISGDPKISDGGEWIFFKSASTNLLPALPAESLAFHLYMFNRTTRMLTRIDESSDAINFDRYSLGSYAVSRDGGVVVFEGLMKSNEDPSIQLDRCDLFLYERTSGTFSTLSKGELAGNSHDPSLSADGRYLSFIYRGAKMPRQQRGLMVMDLQKQKFKKIHQGFYYGPQLSGNGRVIAFESLIKTSPNRPDSMDILVLPNPLAE